MGRIVFLGTGGALNVERAQAALLVEHGATRVLLDAGDGLGTVRALVRAGVAPETVGHVFLSHRHLDHAGGLEAFLLVVGFGARRTGAAPPETRLYASAETVAALRSALASLDSFAERLFASRLAWVACAPGTPIALGELRLTGVAVDHPPADGGALGCTVLLAGARVAYSGDTRPVPALARAAAGADVLVHEAGGLDAQAEAVHAAGHSTAGDAGRIAHAAGVRRLVLTHLPPVAYAAPADLLAEARRAAPGIAVDLAEDGMAITLERG